MSIPYYSYTYFGPFKYSKRFGCFGGAQSQGILEYIPSGSNAGTAETSDLEKIDMNENYNRYIFAVGATTQYPSSNYQWAVMSKGKPGMMKAIIHNLPPPTSFLT